MNKRLKKVVNGYTIRWCPKLMEYHIRKNGKTIGIAYNEHQAIEACKLLPAA